MRTLRLLAMIGVTLLFLMPFVRVAAAQAPFCTVDGTGTTWNCIYFDQQSCREFARTMSGYCAPNPRGARELPGSAAQAPFCTVDSTGTTWNCIYFDQQSCREFARTMGGYCTPNPRGAR